MRELSGINQVSSEGVSYLCVYIDSLLEVVLCADDVFFPLLFSLPLSVSKPEANAKFSSLLSLLREARGSDRVGHMGLILFIPRPTRQGLFAWLSLK